MFYFRNLILTMSFLIVPIVCCASANYWNECKVSGPRECSAPSPIKALLPALQEVTSQNTTIEFLEHKNSSFERKMVEVDSPSSLKTSGSIEIIVNPSVSKQEIWGFGGSVTDSCLENLKKLKEFSPEDYKKLMNTFFSRDSGAGFSYLRVPLGGNDFSKGDYTLNDTTGNRPDPKLEQFNENQLGPMLEFIKEARAINPKIAVMVSPWTPPAWMKKNKSLKGGQLLPKYHGAYAKYLGKAVSVFQKNGIQVKHFTILNEPLIGYAANKWDYPQAYMSVKQQHAFIAKELVPLAKSQENFPKLLLHDHNWDNSKDALALARDKLIKPIVGGVATHCYGGTFREEQDAFAKFRPLNAFNSECTSGLPKPPSTISDSEAEAIFKFWMHTQGIGSLRAGSSGSLGWNLCLDENGGPQNNGCKDCRGLVTINQKLKKIIYNPEFQALSFISRAIQPGAVLLESNYSNLKGIINAAFINPDGQIVVLLYNFKNTDDINVSLTIKPCSNPVTIKVPKGSVAAVRI